ncbi:hypothetical protein EVG20_g4483 [Dentipellis fragilis]|uniref:Uncharacterized protein n=1 Tax=Dentipellis fragilis TaxID=205917 RepID=A0A4Y9YXY2_9AGAM|nr:hypothetical protein EVG20_g4483 [Dentipellis fragilis]
MAAAGCRKADIRPIPGGTPSIPGEIKTILNWISQDGTGFRKEDEADAAVRQAGGDATMSPDPIPFTNARDLLVRQGSTHRSMESRHASRQSGSTEAEGAGELGNCACGNASKHVVDVSWSVHVYYISVHITYLTRHAFLPSLPNRKSLAVRRVLGLKPAEAAHPRCPGEGYKR